MLLFCAVAALGFVSGVPAESQAPEAKSILLVLPMRAEGDLAVSAKALDEMLLDHLFALDTHQVIGASDLNALLGVEKLKDASGCDDVACAAELGGALGAPLLVAGQLTKLGQQVVLSLKLLDTKTPKVLGRASVRGKPDGEALAQLLSDAVATLFGQRKQVLTPPSSTQTTVPPSNNPYAAYTTLMTNISRRVASFEYTRLLEELPGYRRQPITVPEGQNLGELLDYYEVMACFTLKRHACTKSTAKAFASKWPDGLYSNAVRSLVTQVEDEELEREAKADELVSALADIDARAKSRNEPKSSITTARAYAYFSAKRYDDAAKHFEQTLADPALSLDDWFSTTSSLLSALELSGRFDDARKWLDVAEQKDAKRFRLQYLHQKRASMPK